jgi:hypothetical protein
MRPVATLPPPTAREWAVFLPFPSAAELAVRFSLAVPPDASLTVGTPLKLHGAQNARQVFLLVLVTNVAIGNLAFVVAVRVVTRRTSFRLHFGVAISSKFLFPPCSPSATRFVLILRPAALGALLRGLVAQRFSEQKKIRCATNLRPSGLGFQREISRARIARSWPDERAKFLAGASTESAPSALGSRALRVASRKSVPSDIRAKTTWRKRQWHSTKTQSS